MSEQHGKARALLALREKASPGPLVASCRHVDYKGGEWPKDEFLQWELDGYEVPDGRGMFYQGDALFFAAAHDMADTIRDLLAEIEKKNAIISGWVEHSGEVKEENRRLLAENERLTRQPSPTVPDDAALLKAYKSEIGADLYSAEARKVFLRHARITIAAMLAAAPGHTNG